MDETMFGGRRPGKRGWEASGKNIVFGIYQRNGKVLTFPLSSRARETMMPFISKYTKTRSLYYRDDWFAYTSLPIRGNHVVVLKKRGYLKDEIISMESKVSGRMLNIGCIIIVVSRKDSSRCTRKKLNGDSIIEIRIL